MTQVAELCERIRILYRDCPVSVLRHGDGLSLAVVKNAPPEAVLAARGLFDTSEVCGEGRLGHCEYGVYRLPGGGSARWYHFAEEKELRFVFDEKQDLSFLSSEPKERRLCPFRFWQFETDHTLIDCGMCYIFQLSDGSYFLIDSSDQYSVRDPQRLCDFLRERAPGGKAFVRGWFFSHAHSDHICTALEIFRYFPELQIGTLYYNFPEKGVLPEGVTAVSDSHIAQRFLQTVEEKRLTVCRIHSFDELRFGDLTLRVLCTYEDLLPGEIGNFNDTSCVLTAQIGADKICLPGDAGALESRLLEARFGKELSCDVVQAAHHGHAGTSPEFYRLCGAHVVLFPTTQIKFDEELPRFPANDAAVSVAKHCFISSNGTVEFTFPLKENRIRLLPDETFESFEGVYNLWTYEYTRQRKEELRRLFEARQKTEEFDW